LPYLKKEHYIKPRDFTRAGEAAIQVQGLLKSIGLDPTLRRRVSICAYESEMNVVMYGGEGNLILTISPDDTLVLDVKDDGQGIEDIELAMQEGYSTSTPEYKELGFGAGMGLPNIKKNSDYFEIKTGKEGTHLKITFNIV
jgi:serine/threonine-protein kinase RsbT